MDINLWFARDIHTNEIIQVFDANNDNKYTCPICNSEVIPKALESKKVTPHFAHIDRSKCSNEQMIHWWYKHRFIDKGDTFTIKTDKEIQFTCADTDVEVEYELSSGKYKPDLVVRTECGNEIVFEMANTNKKKVEDYIDRWIELDKFIVEVDIKNLVNDKKEFNALYYKGKCFNFDKRDGGYNKLIAKKKHLLKTKGTYNIDKAKNLDWFWSELSKYSTGNVSKDEIFNLMESIEKLNDIEFVKEVLKAKKCTEVFEEYLYYKGNKVADVIWDLSNEYSISKDKIEMEFSRREYYGKLETLYVVLYFDGDSVGSVNTICENEEIKKLLTSLENKIRKFKYHSAMRDLKYKSSDIIENLKSDLNLKLLDYDLKMYVNKNDFHLDLALIYAFNTVKLIRIPDNFIEEQDDKGLFYAYLRCEIESYMDTNKPNVSYENKQKLLDLINHYDCYMMFKNGYEKIKTYASKKDTSKSTMVGIFTNTSHEKLYIYLDKDTCHVSNKYYLPTDVSKYSKEINMDDVMGVLVKFTFENGIKTLKCSSLNCLNNRVDIKEFKYCFENKFTISKFCKSCRKKRKENKV